MEISNMHEKYGKKRALQPPLGEGGLEKGLQAPLPPPTHFFGSPIARLHRIHEHMSNGHVKRPSGVTFVASHVCETSTA